MCVGLLPTATIAKIFHEARLSGPDWHLYGQPLVYCTYDPSPNQLTVGVLPHGTAAGYREEIAATVGTAKQKQQPLPSFGASATAISDCVVVIGCHPVVVVLDKGYLVYVTDQLSGASMSSLSEVETLVKQLLAKV